MPKIIPVDLSPKSHVRFCNQVQIGAPDECREWQGRKQSRPATRNRPGSYGIFKMRDTSYLAHRVAYALTSKRSPSRFVLHTCDNPPCVNPSHLYEGTHADNMKDRRDRGHVANHAGETNGSAKLLTEDVLYIRSAHRRGVAGSAQGLADHFGVTVGLIRRIARGDLWKCATAVGAGGD